MRPLERPEPAAVRGTPAGKSSPLSRNQIVVLAVLLISLSSFLSIFLTHRSHFSAPLYQQGDIAHADIVVPMDALIDDETATQARRDDVAAKALPVYRFNPSLLDDQTSRLKAAFADSRALLASNAAGGESAGRKRKRSFRTLPTPIKTQLRSIMQNLGIKPPADDLLTFLVKEDFKPSMEDQIVLLMKDAYAPMLVPDDTLFTKEKENVHRVNNVTGKWETVPANSISTVIQTRNRVSRQMNQGSRLSIAWRPHVRRILESLIIPNMTLDGPMTKSRQEEDVKNVAPVLRKLKKGKIVLRQGDEVGADHLVQIGAIRKLSRSDSTTMQTIGMAFLVGVLLTIFVFFVRFIVLNQWSYLKLITFLLLTLTINLLLLKGSWFVCESVSQVFLASPFSDKTYFFYLLPFACGSMLITLLAGERCAQIYIIFFSILAGQSIGADHYGYFYILITNLTGILVIRKVKQRIGMIGAGFMLGLAAAVLFFIIQVSKQTPLDLISGSFGAALALLSGLINAIFLVFALPLCERIFMVTTEIRLSELGNLNVALIRELIRKAPGTYNHSIAVGTLCEGAAKAIGLNPLFLRVASLYHDIGKTVQPECFVENQHEINPHDQISARESVDILKGHVMEGIRITKKKYLPSSIVDLIPQHHGTKLMCFFYVKAKTQEGGEVQAEEFRYSGPKPRSKAAAILMLADGIEAAARTLNDRSEDRLLNLIKKIITDTTEDGQFSECDITLSEIECITYGFLETLSSYYHDRIAYPEV